MVIKTKFFRTESLAETEKQMNEFMEKTDIREIYRIESIQGYQEVVIMVVYREGGLLN